MMFVKVNAHTVRCIIGESEITEMGYKLDEICKNQDLASEFMKNIIGKANQAGFQISEDVQAVQATFLPNKQLVLSFMDQNSDEQMDQTIQNLLRAFGLVESVGKERLEEIAGMTGEEKQKAFEECMSEAAPTEESAREQIEVPVIVQIEETPTGKMEERYLIKFHNLDVTEIFCKKAVSVPGKLFKEEDSYLLLSDLASMEEKDKKNFLLLASEYAESVQKDHLKSDYLEEHGDVLIGKEPIEVLRNL